LKAITIVIPPLRRRRGDIPILVDKFAHDLAESEGLKFKGFSPDALELMKQYDWPGNVRELRNFVETAIILNKGEVINSSYVRSNLSLYSDETRSKNLPVPLKMPHDQAEREIIYRTLLALKIDINEIKQMLMNFNQHAKMPSVYQIPDDQDTSVPVDVTNELKPSTLAGMERDMIKQTLNKFAGSRRKTARALQISERTLYRKIREYGL
jgi:DNA-binding NtrC family response regulator